VYVLSVVDGCMPRTWAPARRRDREEAACSTSRMTRAKDDFIL